MWPLTTCNVESEQSLRTTLDGSGIEALPPPRYKRKPEISRVISRTCNTKVLRMSEKIKPYSVQIWKKNVNLKVFTFWSSVKLCLDNFLTTIAALMFVSHRSMLSGNLAWMEIFWKTRMSLSNNSAQFIEVLLSWGPLKACEKVANNLG